MKTKKTDWTSFTKLNAEPNKARLNRYRRHNFILEMIIAGLVGASIALTFVIVHMMVVGSAWTW